MRLFKKEHVFHNDWDTITSAFWLKYPNELQPHVLRVDTLDLDVDSDRQQFSCRRLLSLKYQCPKWFQKFFGATPVGFAFEEATCSLKERKLTLKSCNYTFASFFRVEETCEYTPHPENPQHTLYTQTATYKVSGLGLPVNRAVENAAVAQAAEKSRMGVSVVERLGRRIAEHPWADSCSCCFSSIEEAAAHASKQAQEKYRQLRMHIEQKLRVGCTGATATKNSSDSASSSDSDKSSNSSSSNSSEPQAGSASVADSVHYPLEAFMRDKLKPEAAQQSTAAKPNEVAAAHASGVLPPPVLPLLGVQQRQQQHAQELGDAAAAAAAAAEGADVECPCLRSSPSGRPPIPTHLWPDLQREIKEKSRRNDSSEMYEFHDASAEASAVQTPATSTASASRPAAAFEFPFLTRDASSAFAGAARCQQQQQQPVDWSWSLKENRSSPPQEAASSFLSARRYGLLLSTLGRPGRSWVIK